MSTPEGDFAVSTGDVVHGYPCPKDGTTLRLIDAQARPVVRAPGAWCPECHTVWRLLDEVDLGDLDGLPAADQ